MIGCEGWRGEKATWYDKEPSDESITEHRKQGWEYIQVAKCIQSARISQETVAINIVDLLYSVSQTRANGSIL